MKGCGRIGILYIKKKKNKINIHLYPWMERSERGGEQEFGKNRELFNDFNGVHVLDFSELSRTT